MGISSKLALIAIPIGIAVVVLAAFQKQIRNAFYTAGQTAGQAVTGTVEGFIEPFSKLQFPAFGATPQETQPIGITRSPAETYGQGNKRPEDESMNNKNNSSPGTPGDTSFGFGYGNYGAGDLSRPTVNTESQNNILDAITKGFADLGKAISNPQGVLIPGVPSTPGILVPAYGEKDLTPAQKKGAGVGKPAEKSPKEVDILKDGIVAWWNPKKISVPTERKVSSGLEAYAGKGVNFASAAESLIKRNTA